MIEHGRFSDHAFWCKVIKSLQCNCSTAIENWISAVVSGSLHMFHWMTATRPVIRWPCEPHLLPEASLVKLGEREPLLGTFKDHRLIVQTLQNACCKDVSMVYNIVWVFHCCFLSKIKGVAFPGHWRYFPVIGWYFPIIGWHFPVIGFTTFPKFSRRVWF